MSDNETSDDAALLAELDLLLADPSLWAEPDTTLEDRVVAAITAEAAPSSTSSTSDYFIHAQPSRARRWFSVAGAAAVGAAAAAVLTVAVTRDSDEPADATVAMVGTDLAPGVDGEAEFTTVSSGVQIVLRIPGLPRRDGGDFYQVWLKNCESTELVPAGSFHELDDAIAWAGVDPADYPLITVTREQVAPPKDPLQGSSGEVVVAGALGECPA